jgi:PadR family transcriptional regulator PadR
LESGGLIAGAWEEKETGRKRRYYHITKKGLAALEEKVQSWTELCRAVNRILEKSDGQT